MLPSRIFLIAISSISLSSTQLRERSCRECPRAGRCAVLRSCESCARQRCSSASAASSSAVLDHDVTAMSAARPSRGVHRSPSASRLPPPSPPPRRRQGRLPRPRTSRPRFLRHNARWPSRQPQEAAASTMQGREPMPSLRRLLLSACRRRCPRSSMVRSSTSAGAAIAAAEEQLLREPAASSRRDSAQGSPSQHAPVVDEHLREEKIVLHRAPKLLRRRRLLGGVEQHGELPVRLQNGVLHRS